MVVPLVALRVTELSYRYPNGTEALRDVTFSVEEGRRVALLGPNGSGKTTLLRCLNGLVTPTQGLVEVLGKAVEKGSLDWVRARLQLVFQNPDDQLFAPSVDEDVAFGPRNLGLGEEEVAARVEEVLSSLGLRDLRRRNPGQLSQGQKRLVAIAGVVGMRPSIIALDEPTSDLDVRSSKDILEVLDAFTEAGKTIIVATHDVGLAAAWADEVILLSQGRIVAQGVPAEVFYGLGDIEEMGIRTPPVVSLFRRLADEGLADPKARPMTFQELLDAVLVTIRQT